MKHSAFAFLTVALSSITVALQAVAADFDQLRRKNLDKKDAFSFPVRPSQ